MLYCFLKTKPPFHEERTVGAPWRIRIPDLVVRSHTLYPAELTAHIASNSLNIITQPQRKIKPFFGFF